MGSGLLFIRAVRFKGRCRTAPSRELLAPRRRCMSTHGKSGSRLPPTSSTRSPKPSWWIVLLILMVGPTSSAPACFQYRRDQSVPRPTSRSPRLGLHPVAFTTRRRHRPSRLRPASQITAAVIAYSSGTFSMSDYAKVGWVAVLIAIAYGILVMAPWYAFLGVPVWDPAAAWPFGSVPVK